MLGVYKSASARITTIEQGTDTLTNMNVLVNIEGLQVVPHLELVEKKITALKDIKLNDAIKEVEAASAHSKDADELLGQLRTSREKLISWVGHTLMTEEDFEKSLGVLRDGVDSFYRLENMPRKVPLQELAEAYDCGKLPSVPWTVPDTFWIRCVLVRHSSVSL